MKFSIKRKKTLTFIAAPIFILTAFGSLVIGGIISTKNSDAISGWDAGNIISDYVMTNKSSMSTGEIQAFLNSKVPNCDTWGEQTSEFGGGTRRQWAEARGYNPPYTCLRDYSQNGKSAAQIIRDASYEFNINPQVLIVLLQKEQGLVTDTWPLSTQYRSATGYGCPDTAACDSDYYGFTNQVRWASRMFRAILDDSPTWYTPYELGNNFIRYSPDSSCGGSNVYIQNRSTQALYNYTPYQPNQGALNAGWGTAHCGAYGNRNFYLYFTSWFGSTQGKVNFVNLNDPRWMQLKNDARKIDPLTGQRINATLPQGTQLKFLTKTPIKINGVECLRTEADTRANVRKCIPMSDIEELVITLEPISDLVMRASDTSYKHDLRRNTPIKHQPIQRTQQITYNAKMTLGSDTYYITKHDNDHGIKERGVPSSIIKESTSSYENIQPRRMELTTKTRKEIPTVNVLVDTTLPEGLQRLYTSRAFVDGEWYYRTAHDGELSFDKAIPASKLKNVEYIAFDSPRWMQIKDDIKKSTPIAGGMSESSLSSGQKIKFTSKVYVDGKWYYRTESDTNAGLDRAVPANKAEEVAYTNFLSPREMRLKQNSTKHIPSQQTPIGETYPLGMVRKYNSKIEINGTWYYRSESDTLNKRNTAMRATDLEEIN